MAKSGYGIFASQRRMRREREAAELERREAIGGIDIGVDELISSSADPAEAKAWQDQFDTYRELALSQDELQQREGLNGLSNMAAAVRAAVDRRHERQETFIVEHARELRDRHQKAVERMRPLQANMEQLNALLKDPEFQQNVPINRGTLTTLLDSTARQMTSDPADFASALQGAGAPGLFGALMNVAGGLLDAKDFELSKEDYGRLARAMYTVNEKRYRETIAPLELEAAALEEAAGGLEFLPPGYSLTRYITGGGQDFANPLQSDYSGADTEPAAPVESAASELGRLVTGGGESGGDPERAAAGPQFAGVMNSDAGVVERLTGTFDIGAELNGQISAAAELGATVKADPETGALYAIYPDGRREEIPTSTVKRTYVQNALRRQTRSGQQRVEGVIQR